MHPDDHSPLRRSRLRQPRDKTWFHLRLSEMKGSVCVSTVSIVGGINGDPPDRARADQIGMTVVVADAADGADGVRGRMHPDDPASGAALTTKGYVDAQGAQEGLSAPQSVGQRPGIFGPVAAAHNDTIVAAIRADPQQVSRAAGP